MPARTRKTVLAYLVLASLTLGAFLPVVGNSFIELDDPQYVFINRNVRSGLTLDGVRWAFRSFAASNWHPLTWVSHMLDVELFGIDPGRHHLSSLLLHLASVLLLVRVLTGLTGSLPRALLAAALFGLHPLRVESVAWIAERKDVLSGLCFMLGLGAYARYVRRPGAARYLLVLLAHGLGLLSKPMVVTFPGVLLLLDFWPLGRFGPVTAQPAAYRLLGEKVPLLALSAASGVVTILAQGAAGAVQDISAYPLGVRVANALLSGVGYLGKIVWPAGLYLPYSHPGHGVSALRALLAALILGLVSAGAVRLWRRRPALATGWFWYLGMLVPVIGLIQVADQGLADRYTYLPTVGLLLALVWGLGGTLPAGRPGKISVAVLAVLALVPLTQAQARRWRDSITLFEHAVSLDPQNPMARLNLGTVYALRGKFPEAVACFEESLRLNPQQAEAHFNLALLYARTGRFPEAVREYSAVLRQQPDNARAHFGLGLALEKLDRREEAEPFLREALRLDPALGGARDRLAAPRGGNQ